jgi:hypothetical protein
MHCTGNTANIVISGDIAICLDHIDTTVHGISRDTAQIVPGKQIDPAKDYTCDFSA